MDGAAQRGRGERNSMALRRWITLNAREIAMGRKQSVLEYSMDRTSLVIMGSIFTLIPAGLLVFLLVEAEQLSWEPLLALTLFIFIGLIVLLIRRGVIIDRDRGTVTSWWGLYKPFRFKTHPLEQFKSVMLIRKVTRSKSKERYTRTTVKYHVSLNAEEKPRELDAYRAANELATKVEGFIQHPAKILDVIKNPDTIQKRMADYKVRMQPYLSGRSSQSLEVCAMSDLPQARVEAERIAKFLDVPLHDVSSGKILTRETGTLDVSIREKALRAADSMTDEPHSEVEGGVKAARDSAMADISNGSQQRTPAEPPEGCRIVQRSESQGWEFQRPVPTLTRLRESGLWIMIPILLVMLVIFPFDTKTGSANYETFLIPGVVAAMFLYSLFNLLLRKRLTLTDTHILIEYQRLFGRRESRELLIDDIEELEVVRSEGYQADGKNQTHRLGKLPRSRWVVRATADRGSLEFGHGLSREELEWLRETLLYLVVSSDQAGSDTGGVPDQVGRGRESTTPPSAAASV